MSNRQAQNIYLPAFIAVIFGVSGCTDPMTARVDEEQIMECQSAQSDLARYGAPGPGLVAGTLFWGGPCMGTIYDHSATELVTPSRLRLLFNDLSTGRTTEIIWVGGEIVSIDKG